MNNRKIIEALLFASGKEGLTFEDLLKKSKISNEEIESTLDESIAFYISNDETSLMIKKFGSKYKLVTKPEIIKLINVKGNVVYKNPLNNNLLEILAIIAYNVPCKKSLIFDLRKKDPGESIKKLVEMGFVSDLGRADSQGKPFIYGITDLFYDTFGVSSLEELPKIEKITSFDEETEVDFFDINRDDNEQ